MINMEKISETAMNVITFAGLAKSCYIEALRLFRKNERDLYLKKIEEGNEYFTKAHNFHAKILHEEMATGESQITMLLAHAEDQLMASEIIKTIFEELVGVIDDLKGEKNDI